MQPHHDQELHRRPYSPPVGGGGTYNGDCTSDNSWNDNTQGTRGGGSSNGGTSPPPPQIFPISQHVLSYNVNGSATRLKNDWTYLVSKYGQPSSVSQEADYWRILCTQIDRDACQGGLRQTFGAMDSAYSTTGTTLLAGGILITGGVSGNGDEQSGGQSPGDLGIRSLNDPASMRGATVEEFEALARDAGLMKGGAPPESFTGGDGAVYYNPGDKRIQVMWEKGDPNATAGDVHQGQYFKWNFKGYLKIASIRIPGNGNPNPGSGDFAPYPEFLTEGYFGADAGGVDPLGSPEDGAGTEAGAAP